MSKITPEAFISECARWLRDPHKTDRLGQRLMNAFSVGGSNPDIFYQRDPDKAVRDFYDAYVK